MFRITTDAHSQMRTIQTERFHERIYCSQQPIS